MRNPFKKQPEVKLSRYEKRHRTINTDKIYIEGKEVYINEYIKELAKMNHKRFPEIDKYVFYQSIKNAYMKSGKTKDAVKAGERLIYRGLVNRIKSPIGKRLFIIRFRYLVAKIWVQKAVYKIKKSFRGLKNWLQQSKLIKKIKTAFPK